MRAFRRDVEGLRGVAVLLVVASHFTGWPRGGFLGVDVFFVLSGLLITGLLLDEAGRSGRIDLRAFYARRARRLLPAAAVVLLATNLAAGLLLLPARAHAVAVDSLWALGSAVNWELARLGTDYFAQNRPPSPVQHYWSLSVEEQFYLLWPGLVAGCLLVAARLGGRSRRVVGGAAALVVAGSFAWSAATAGSGYFSSAARAWEIGLGALLAVAGRRAPARSGVLALAGAAGLAASVLLIGPGAPVPGWLAAGPALSTVALLHARPAALGVAPLRAAGRISYSLYLWHWPVLVLGQDLPGGRTAAGRLLQFALSVLLAAASHRWVEAPVRRSRWLEPGRGGRRLRPLAAAPVAACLALLLLALAASGPAAPGPAPVAAAAAVLDGPATVAALQRQVQAGLRLASWPASVPRDVAGAGAPEWFQDGCLDVGPRNAARCVYGPATGRRTVVVLGDSIAVSWLPTLRVLAERQGWRLHVLTRRQCPNPVLPGGRTRAVSASCAAHQRWAAAAAVRLRPDLLVLSNRYGGADPARWRSGTQALLRRLGPLARRAVLLAPPPDTGNLLRCRSRVGAPAGCVLPVDPERAGYLAAERAAAQAAGAAFVDTTGWFCAAGRCPAVVAGLPVHIDGEHLSAGYARHLAGVTGRSLGRRVPVS